MYTAYVLTPAARAKLLEAFPPKFPDVIAHHATLKFGVPKDAEAPAPAELMAVGYANDESLEAVVVSVDGTTKRPDGSTYHITLSLDRSKGRKPVDSNKVVQAGWEPIAQPFAIETLPQKLAADKKASHTNSEGFWAGEGNAASGILPVCPAKGTVCLAMRSERVHMGGCWGTIGGAIIEGMSPAESAKQELAEETGYTGGITLIPTYVFTSGGGFTYHNYIGVVPTEFSLNPQKGGTGKLKHSDETDYISWVPWQNVLDDVAKAPDDYHPGMRKMLVESKDEIERALQIPKTAATPRMAPEPPVKPLTRQQVKKLVDDAANATYEAPETLDPQSLTMNSSR
jgi:8-oxo-dGTP pyrophosphatase MutT (NUDIX family)